MNIETQVQILDKVVCLSHTAYVGWLVGWLVVLFYSISALFGSFNAKLNFKQLSLA